MATNILAEAISKLNKIWKKVIWRYKNSKLKPTTLCDKDENEELKGDKIVFSHSSIPLSLPSIMDS